MEVVFEVGLLYALTLYVHCTVYLMAKCIFPKPLLKSAMMRCLQKIRGKVNIFEKATKISQLLFELTNKQIIVDFYS